MSIKKRTALLVLAFSFFGVTSCADIKNYSEISSERNKSIVPDIDYYDLAYNIDIIVLPAELKTKGNVDIDNNFSGELQISNWGNAIKDATQKEIHNSDRFIEFGHYNGRIEISAEVSSVSISNVWSGIRSKCNVAYTYKDLVTGKILSKHDSAIEVMALLPTLPKSSNSFLYSFDQLTYAIAREAIVGLIRLPPIADIQLTQKQVKFYNSNIKRKSNQIISHVPIDTLINKNKKELNSALSTTKKMQKNRNKLAKKPSDNRKKNKPEVRVDSVSAPATPPMESNTASDTSTVKNDKPNYDDSGYIATPEHYQLQYQVSAEQERAMDEWIKEERAKLQRATGNAASPTGYTAAPGHYQPQYKVSVEQERAMDELLKEEEAKLQRATGNAASPTGYTAAPGHYQPQNKVEAEQERAMD